jgi:hypothetical protein
MPKNVTATSVSKDPTTKAKPFAFAYLLPKIATSEDDGQQDELARLAAADAECVPLIFGGVLLSEEATDFRLSKAVERLAEEELPDLEGDLADEVGSVLLHHTHWAYRLGFVVGLRLAMALNLSVKGGAR